MADTTKTVLMVGGLGVGAYLFYEWTQYSNAMSYLAGGNQSQISAGESALPFLTYLQFNLMGSSGGTTTQVQIYQMIQQYLTTGSVSTASGTPGTTGSSQQTSVSTSPTSTPTQSASSSPTTTNPNPPSPPQALPISSRVSIVSPRSGIAFQMQQKINMSLANADQWNWAYAQITGHGLDQQYGFTFDSVYGKVVNGVRNNGQTMSAQVFLQLAAAAVGGMKGLSTIAMYAGPALNTTGNMIYGAHHQFPYVPTYSALRGLGAVTQASGFEKALFTDQRLRSNRIR